MLNLRKQLWPIPRLWLAIAAIALLLLAAGGIGVRAWYNHNLGPVSSSSKTEYFTVSEGESLGQIANALQQAGLIRNSKAFEAYVRGIGATAKLQAGTYILSPSMSAKQIVDKMINGEVSKNLLTILPGKRLDQVKEAFVKAGYSSREIEAAFKPATHGGHPVLKYLPRGQSLEGYLYPESFLQQSNTPPATIVRQSLDEMAKYLNDDLIADIKKQKLSVHQAIIMASIVYQESDDPRVQPTIAQVLLKRYKEGIKLQSDPTAFYASDIAGKTRSLRIDSPYNTYLYEGLPPGPISNLTIDALKAVANPAKTDYLFFVAGDDGRVHFSKTVEEHDRAVERYCTKACGR